MGKHKDGTRLIGAVLRGLVLLLAVGLVGGAGWYVVANNAAKGAEGGCETTLRVVTASSFATVVSAAGRTLRGGSNCVLVDTTTSDGRPAAGQLSQSRADLWIPDDAAWDVIAPPRLLAKKDTLNAYATLATSPIYMVTDPATGDRITAGGGSWLSLAGLLNTKNSGVRMVVRNPAMSGDGMVAAGAVGEAVWLDKGMDASSLVLTNVLGVTRTVNHDLAAIPEAAGEVGLIPEYALLATLRLAKSDRRYIVGSDHTAMLRYTWLPSAAAAADPKKAAALRRLYAAFTSAEGSRAIAEAGLRGPDNLRPIFDGANVLPEPTAKPFEVLQPHHVQHIFATWDPEDRRSNLLIIVDLATNGTAGGSPTNSASPPPGKVQVPPLDVLRNGCVVLAGLMPVGSRLGLWEVSPGTPGYRKLMPTDRLDDTSRTAFGKQVGKLAAHRSGPGLFDAVVAGYRSVRDDYHDDMFNQVLVFTDDQNKDSADTAAVDDLVRKLTALQDPNKPVSVSIVVLGKKDSADRLKTALKPIDAYVDNALTTDDVQAAFIHVVAGGLHE
ncbi:substrate-binding domain-containing protein [Dactylosporangium sp. NPDC005555]|uniref:substrate-binding domain-containing protein n=1 Tax=Dactylosporangium sp. NPDC005555 TaxID=3154889 RepID=UPI0033AC28DB